MKYSMRSNILFDENNNRCARVSSSASYLKNKICSSAERMLNTELRMNSSFDANDHEFILTDSDAKVIAYAKPRYSKSEDPHLNGWPLNRAPLVDEAILKIEGEVYVITRVGYPKYELRDSNGVLVLGAAYSSLMRNWSIYTKDRFTPDIVCAIVVFCKYLEFENEAVIV